MLGVRISRCTYCRILAQYVQRRNTIYAWKERSLQVLPENPGVQVARTLRTTQQGFSNTKDSGNDGSSSSDSSSDSSDSDSDKDDSPRNSQKDKEMEKKTSEEKIPGTENKVQTPKNVSSRKQFMAKKKSKPALDIGNVLKDLKQQEIKNKADTPTMKAEQTKIVYKTSNAKTGETKKTDIKDFLARLKERNKKRLDVKPENVVEFLMEEKARNQTGEEAQKMSEEEKSTHVKVDENIVQAVKEVSQELPGKPKETEAALIGQLLKQFSGPTVKQDRPRGMVGIQLVPKATEGMEVKSMSDQYSTMLKGFSRRKEGRDGTERLRRRRKDGDDSEEINKREVKVSSLFSGRPLNIFMERAEELPMEEMSLFDIVALEEKLQESKGAPKNAFHEQIQWTKEGKMWTFPIDNEAGWEEEHNTEFYEHVFFDEQLQGFPEKGPVRHFMELVTTALSKNPYLSVRQKHEHIDWYRQYFMEKGAVLKEHLGKMGEVHQQQSSV